jgi:hypothetical protein
VSATGSTNGILRELDAGHDDPRLRYLVTRAGHLGVVKAVRRGRVNADTLARLEQEGDALDAIRSP